MTNDMVIAEALEKICLGGHRHVQLVSGRAAAAAIYPPALCRTMLEGLDMSLRGVELLNLDAEVNEDLCEDGDKDALPEAAAGVFWDDLKSQELDPQVAR